MNDAQHVHHLAYLEPHPGKESAYKVSMSTGLQFWRRSRKDTKKKHKITKFMLIIYIFN